MATIEQIQDLNHFIQALPEGERSTLSIDEIYERGRKHAFREEDLLAVKASLRDFENGERGRPVTEFLAELDAELQGPNAGERK